MGELGLTVGSLKTGDVTTEKLQALLKDQAVKSNYGKHVFPERHCCSLPPCATYIL